MLKKLITPLLYIVLLSSCEKEDVLITTNSENTSVTVVNNHIQNRSSANITSDYKKQTKSEISITRNYTFFKQIYVYQSGLGKGKYVASYNDALQLRKRYSDSLYFYKPPKVINIKYDFEKKYYYEDNWEKHKKGDTTKGGEPETDVDPEEVEKVKTIKLD